MTTRHENLTRAEARTRAALLSDVEYHVELDLTRGDAQFGSVVEATFACAEPGASTFIDCTAGTVHEVVLNGRPVDLSAVEPTRIQLDGLAATNTLRVVADMEYQHDGKGLHFFRDPTDDAVYLHSQCEPFDAHLIYACFDQPDLKARFTFAVEAPEGWVVVSNEPATSRPAEGEAGRWTFATTPLLSPYVTAVVAGAYASVHHHHGDVALGLYVRRSLLEHLDHAELFELTRQGLEWFDDNFGITYPFTKYDQLFVPEFSAGAMENPGCVTFSESYVFRSRVTDAQRERRAETVLHEMAHMWFGDLVTMRWWDDLWLNESFATYASVLSQVEATRFRNGWVTFLDSEKAWAKYQDQLPTTHPIAADLVDVEAVHQNFDGITYAKGASVLRQLVAWVGQEPFLAGCRAYFDAHQWGNAEEADFLAALEQASGRELSDWRDAWLETTGVNTLSCEYTVEDGAFTSFAVLQTDDADDVDSQILRPHRIAIGVYARQGDTYHRIQRVELDVRGARTEVGALIGANAGDVVLVNDDDLTFAKITIDERSMAHLTEDLRLFVDPLARALVWGAAWDMVRDAHLPASQFVDLVVANLDSESEVGVLQRLGARSVGAALRYGHPDNHDTLLDALAGQALGELQESAPGSGHQLAWARQFAAAARSAEALEQVRALLDGSWVVDGLEVDTELRWHLLTSLAAAGAAGVDAIEAEYRRDPTDIGERHALTARAARPDPAAKETAWSLLVDDDQLSHTRSRHVWTGFRQLGQPDLIEPFVERYFDVLDRIWDERSLDWAIEFTSAMYPHPVASLDVATRTRKVLERDDLPGPLRRVLLEELDVLQRTLAARDLDRPT